MIDDDDAGDVEVTVNGVTYRASYDVADGELYLHHPDYIKAPMKLMPGRDIEDQARFMLKELVSEIAIGTARKRPI